ncbi:MAG TPA: ADP-ribosylglycohydrolase family protein [Streptosporangiaceae bacterium]|nr:ADP-ribosylglycohydrolase family protein [Streptosporangiaceae bacterium]
MHTGEPGNGTQRADRIAGALLGVHAGDALGATLEFSAWSAIRQRYPDGLRDIVGGGPFGWPPGHATDDTDLTRAVLLAYLDAGPGAAGGDVVRLAADHMLAWLDGDWPGREPGSRPLDVGGATLAGLEWYRRSGDPRAAGAGEGHAGNGSLMRCIPTALTVADRRRRISESIEISAITHDDERAVTACAAYNEIAAALVAGLAPADCVAIGLATAHELGSAPVAAAITRGRLLEPAPTAASGDIAFPASGYVLDSLSLAVAAVLDRRPLADVLVDIARIGNDTDTNAAIAGGLLGARDGAGAIPSRWTAALQFGVDFTAAAAVLAVSG